MQTIITFPQGVHRQMQKELLPIYQFMQAFNVFADRFKDSESLADYIDEIATQISCLLNKIGYYSTSKRSFYELMTWEVPVEDCTERTMALTDAITGLAVNNGYDNSSAYILKCFDIDYIYNIIYGNRIAELGSLNSASDDPYFIYPQSKVLADFLEKGVLAKIENA